MDNPTARNDFQYIIIAGAVSTALALSVSAASQSKATKLQSNNHLVLATEKVESVIDSTAKCIWGDNGYVVTVLSE
jgi:hypothetical protein